MTKRAVVFALSATLLLTIAGCGGSATVVAGAGTPTVDSISGGPFITVVPTPFTVIGNNFESLAGPNVVVRFTAVGGVTPFAGGTSDTADVPGTVIDNVTVIGTTPSFVYPGSFFATVTVIMPNLAQGTSATAIAEFLGLQVTGFAPPNLPSDAQDPFTVAGSGFDPVGNTATVTFIASTGTPFLGGTTNTLSVVGNVDSQAQISGIAPIAGVSIPADAFVMVTLDNVVGTPSSTSLTPLVTFDPPTVDSAVPLTVPSEIPTATTITGTGFGPVAGVAQVRLTAVAGTPFLNGTASFIDVLGTVTSGTTIDFTTPIFQTNVDVPTLVGVTLPSGAGGVSSAAILTVLAPTVDSAVPANIPSEVPTLTTITGTGFAPNGSNPTVRFRATVGTPFLGGTAAFLDVAGTVVNETTITCTTPRAGISVATPSNVGVFLTTGISEVLSIAPIITFDPPTITSAAPATVESEIPTTVALTGTGFGSATGLCNVTLSAVGTPFALGTLSSLQVTGTIVNPTTITFTSPIAGVQVDVNADLTLTFPTNATATAAGILLIRTPAVTASSLASVPSEIPTVITITGSGFAGGTPTVRFANGSAPFLGGTAATIDATGVTIVNSTTITCTTPRAGTGVNAGATIQVLLTGGLSPISTGTLVTFLAPTITSVSPTAVESELPQTVTLTGTGFGSSSGTCNVTLSGAGTPFSLGTQPSLTVLGTVVNPTTITFTSPICGVQADLNADLTLTFPTNATATAAGILLIRTPTVTASSLASVPSEIPTVITITGSGFAGGTPTVRFASAGSPFFGGTASTVDATGVTIVNGTTITCTTPRAGTSVNAGSTIQVLLTGGLSPISTGTLVTFLAPTITSVSPTSVESEIPQVVTITGTGFGSASGNCNVTLSGAGTPFSLGTQPSLTVLGTVVNPTTITFTSPISGVQSDLNADVTVTFATGASATSAGLLLIRTPTVTSSSPATVDSENPTLITITGTGFAGGTPTVRFANGSAPFAGGTVATIDATGVTIVNPTTITCTTPRAGTNVNAGATIQVLLTGGLNPISTGPLVTFLTPTAVSCAPTLVDAATATLVTVTGTGFYAPGTVTMRFTAATGTPFAGSATLDVTGATVVNPTTVTATTPVLTLANKAVCSVGVIFASGAAPTTPAGCVTFEVPPIAVDDNYGADGNVQLVVNAANGVINGVGTDSDPDGDPISVSAFDALSVSGGNVAVAADGSFTYNPAPGFEGADSFTYTITDGFLFDTATVNLTVSGMVWFIDNTAAPGGDGRFTSPWDAFSDFTGSALDGVGDTIFVYSSATDYTGNATLLVSQLLLGQGVALVHPGGNSASPLVAASTNPTVDSAAGTTITVSTGNTIRGLDIDSTNGTALGGTVGGTLTVNTLGIGATGGPAVDLTGGTLACTFTTITSATSSSDGIDLEGVAGTFTVSGVTTITGAADDGIDIGNATATVTFTGTVSTTGCDNGIHLTTGTADVNFGDVNITTPLDDGILIDTAAGTFDVTGTCDIDTPGNAAGTPSVDHGVDINSSSCAVTFADLDINDSTGHGIELNGNSGAFQMDDGLVDNVDDVGLHATNCTGTLTLGTASAGPSIQESGDGAVNAQEGHCVRIEDCTGNIRIENCTLEDANETATGAGQGFDNNGIHVYMDGGGTLASLQIVDCTFVGTEAAGLGTTTDHGIFVRLEAGSIITDMDVTGCTCSGVGRAFCEVLVDGDDSGDNPTITSLHITDNGSSSSPIESQAECVHVRCNGSSIMDDVLIDNNFLGVVSSTLSSGNGIRLNTGEFPIGINATSRMRVTITDNTIRDVGNGANDNGIETQTQNDSTLVALIDNNTINGGADVGIRCRVFDTADANITISSNTIGTTSTHTGEGIEVQTRSGTPVLCINVVNNVCATGDAYVMNHDAGTFALLDIVGIVGGATPWTPAEVDTYLGSSGVNKNNVGTKASLAGTYTNCTSITTP